MSIVKNKNFSYIRGPKGDKGDRGADGTGIANTTGRITYNPSTKTVGFNETGLATTAYVNSSINSLINGAPVLLDTLNELAEAIGNNPNFIPEITASIATKLSLSGGVMTGPLILDANPVSHLGAATKQYVDDATSSITINSTTDVPEGTNLYYTTARVNSDFDTRLATKSTTNLAEGTNLYYTDARFDARLATKSTTNLAEGTNKYYTDARARLAISVSGDLNYNNNTGVISLTIPALFSGSYTDLTNKPTIPTNINSLTDVDTTTTTPSVGDALIWNGTNWAPGASATSVVSGATLDGGSF
jgi:hypothetical protein